MRVTADIFVAQKRNPANKSMHKIATCFGDTLTMMRGVIVEKHARHEITRRDRVVNIIKPTPRVSSSLARPLPARHLAPCSVVVG
jgi:hypothetical protein